MTRDGRARTSVAERLLRTVMSADEAASIVGDLDEEQHRHAPDQPNRFSGLTRARHIAAYFFAAYRFRLSRAVGRREMHSMEITSRSRLGRIVGSLRMSGRDALRTFRRFPGTTTVALVVLMLGIAAATVTFSVVDAVVLRHLPYPDDERLVALYGNTQQDGDVAIVSPADYFTWRDQTTAFESLAAWMFGTVEVGTGDTRQTVWEVRTTASLFPALRVPMLLGAPFGADRELNGRDDVAVISYGLWQRQFGGDPGVVGKRLTTATGSVEVAGVAPKGFVFPPGSTDPIDLWMPYVASPSDRSLAAAHGRSSYLQVIGRLRDGVSLEQARSQAEQATAALASQYPTLYDGWSTRVSTLRSSLIQRVRGWMMLSLWAVTLVMLVACVNVANLLLARTTARERDLAVRAALGASRLHIAQSLLVESLLLSCLAAGAGVALAYWGLAVVKAALPAGIARASDIALDGRVLFTAITAAVVTGLAFGTVPAWMASRANPIDSLKDGGANTSSPVRRRWRSAFLVAQSAFVVVLLTATTLLVTSFLNVIRTDLGFTPQNLLGFRMAPSFPGASPAEVTARTRDFYARAVDAVRAVPGVTRVATMGGGEVPLFMGSTVSMINLPATPNTRIRTELRRVSPDYFDVTGTRLLAGRTFTENDRDGAPPVVILDTLAAARAFGDRSAIGATVHFPVGDATVVGVVNNMRLLGPEATTGPEAYRPLAQEFSSPRLAVRTSLPPAQVAPAAVAAIKALLPAGATVQTFVVEDRFRRITADRRFNASVMGALGLLALVIGAVGTYGVTASVVGQQRREIGVRIALGATTGRVVRSVMGSTGRLLATGAAVGLVGSAAIARTFAALLFEIRTTDLIVYAVPVVLLAAAGLMAAFLPARRASRVDVLVTLRQE